MSAPPIDAPPVITLHPGDVAIAERGQVLETLLGSCVAIALTDPSQTVGALCHIVHPGTVPVGHDAGTAYLDGALQALVELLQRRGLAARLCEAHVYGGGNMFPDIVAGPGVGRQNAERALDALVRLGARVGHVDVGGSARRRLRWRVGSPPVVVAVPT